MADVGIVGGGAIGLATAYYAKKAGHNVTLFEAGQLGGLASSLDINGEPLEKYYHHFFLSDENLLELIEELGIRKKVKNYHAKMGFFVCGKRYRFDGPLDLLKFSPLSFISRIKLGGMVLYFQHFKKWKHLDKISAEKWVSKYVGKQVWDVMWKPLFYSKFTDKYKKIPAAWLWGRINARGGSRENGKEVLCYLDGSYQTFIDKLVNDLRKKGVHLVMERVTSLSSGKVVAGKKYEFDKIVFTASPKILSSVANLPLAYEKKITNIPYQGIVCMVLELKHSLSDIYWLNINDPKITFGGVIEHTNLIPKKRYKSHVVYLFNYIPRTHRVYKLSDQELLAEYIEGLQKIFPKFKKSDIVKYHISRAPFANPVFFSPFLSKIPPVKTPLKNIFMLNMTHIYPQDRNVSHSIGLAKNFVKEHL